MRYVSHITAIVLFLGFVFALSSHAENRHSWKYLYTIDGDSLVFEALWSPLPEKTIIIRLDGIDTPEHRGQCEYERVQALKAKDFVSHELNLATQKGQKIEVAPLAWDKYGGRLISKVYVDSVDLSEKILRAGLAREYHGEKKQGWC